MAQTGREAPKQMTSSKFCSGCKMTKPEADFYRSVGHKCKACLLIQRHAWIANNPNARVAIRQAVKRYQSRKPEAYRRAQRKYDNAHNHEKYLRNRTSTKQYKPRSPRYIQETLPT